jgi:hypothetical protein
VLGDVVRAAGDALEEAEVDGLLHPGLRRVEVFQELLLAKLTELFATRHDPRPRG